ncbi:hypothetical protein [Pseudomonas cerasi]
MALDAIDAAIVRLFTSLAIWLRIALPMSDGIWSAEAQRDNPVATMMTGLRMLAGAGRFVVRINAAAR